MNPLLRNAILNTMNGAIAGAQDYAFGWAIASSAVSAFALSSTQSELGIVPTSVAEAKERAILPMFALGMAGWFVGRKLFPVTPALPAATTATTPVTPVTPVTPATT